MLEKVDYDSIKKNIQEPSLHQLVPSEVLMLVQVLHAKGIKVKGVVPHGTIIK